MKVTEDGKEKKTYKTPILYLRKSKAGNHLYAFNVEKDGKKSVLGGGVESLLVNISDVQAVIDGKMEWAKVSVLSSVLLAEGFE